MKKIFAVFYMLMFAFDVLAIENDELTKVREWSVDAIVQTAENEKFSKGPGAETTLNILNYMKENNFNASVTGINNVCSVGMYSEWCNNWIETAIDSHNSMFSGGTTRTRVNCEIPATLAIEVSDCDAQYADNPTELERCKKCVNHAGTYEMLIDTNGNYKRGKCFIEVNGWNCEGKGKWLVGEGEPESKHPECPSENRYYNCRVIRKYIDAEQDFICDAYKVYEEKGKNVVLTGCAQHGISLVSKHPPFSISPRADIVEINCRLPLRNNTDWRKLFTELGEALSITKMGGDKKFPTTNWCMPNPNGTPYNSKNEWKEPGGHYANLMEKGQRVNFWNQEFNINSLQKKVECNTGYSKIETFTSYKVIDKDTDGYQAYLAKINDHNYYVSESQRSAIAESQCNELKSKLKTNYDNIQKQNAEMKSFATKITNWAKQTSNKFEETKTEKESDAFAMAAKQLVQDLNGLMGERWVDYYLNTTFKCTGTCNRIPGTDDIVTCKNTNETIEKKYIFDSICKVGLW